MNARSVTRTQFVSARMEALHAPAKWDTQATVLAVKVRLNGGHDLRCVWASVVQ